MNRPANTLLTYGRRISKAKQVTRRMRWWAAATVVIGLIQVPFASRSSFGSNPVSDNIAGAIGEQVASKKPVVTFGTQTSSATTPDGRGYYAFGGDSGGRLSDNIAIINYSTQPITLLLRPVDGVNTPQGGFAAVPINQPSKDVGTWISLPGSAASVNLPPRSDVIVPFQVKVPKDASPGDHFGVITATLVGSAESKSGQRIQLFQTVGTRVFVRVSGPLHPAIAVENLKVRYSGTLNPIGTGRVRLSYTIHNLGNVALGGKQTVYVTGLFGAKRVAVHVPRIELLLPHFSVKQTVTITGVFPEIRDTGHVSITPLYIAGTINPASGPFKSSVGFWAIPWTLIAIIVALALLIVWWFWRRRRRKTPPGTVHRPLDVPSPEAMTPWEEERDEVPFEPELAPAPVALNAPNGTGHEVPTSPGGAPASTASENRDWGIQ